MNEQKKTDGLYVKEKTYSFILMGPNHLGLYLFNPLENK